MPPSSSSAASTSVQVALRIRPATTQDSTLIPARFQRAVIHAAGPTIVTVDASSSSVPSAAGSTATTATTVSAIAKKQSFSFDQVHPPATTQHAIFTSTAQPLISRFVDGFNCTILAYGQTSSGKTFTMTGTDLEADPSDPNNGMGIIPRAVSTIFSRTRQFKQERGNAWIYNIKGSFIEIYNEDLIDLLSVDDVTGGRREVQIREDKDGHIIWGGLREVNVKNPNEVMNLLRQGTSIRRTNETDMNAQSSRSHAIFSLTLTQKKFKGSGLPPRSSSPLPPGGRSPSRLVRPGSMYSGPASGTRMSSPTFGRPATPSFVSAKNRGGGPMRSASALGLHPSDARSPDDEPGEWVTIVSKFHFVDLAGSERLKRTAAAGERIKEGISINSGLLALGNVISALGDPSRAKSHTASHVPYRDSKLTRLLQDSLGGNAHTLMIACVSPAEWNVGETVNTLKYANRARNIKNRAVVNEKEDGWDDVEWLQGTVTRLRKELKVIKEGGQIGTSYAPPEVLEGAGKKVLAQMTELQNNYEDLREKFVERTEELTRLRRELGERQRGSTAGAVGGTAKYEEIVGPVIEEYEKTIGAMEAELNLNRAALRHTNEMVEEKEDELAMIVERHAATELYVEELRSRLSKLSEREASTEAYVRDLEEKIKSYDETSITSSESMTDLKREVARFKDTESHSGKYIADLEARLARSDESILMLQQTVEKLETESDRRRDEAELLQSRLDALKQDGENWRTDLEERERKVRELEEKMQEWERKRKDAGEERLRLGSVVGEVAQARKSLEVLGLNGSTSSPVSGASTPNKVDHSLEIQLVALRQTHTATLADLSSVTSKYRDALQEISDLAAQIQEAKFNNVPIAESPATELLMDVPDIPPFRRRLSPRTRESTEPPVNSPSRRLFFRQAVSVESLHSRSLSQSQLQSLSLSQELSSARSRKASTSSHGADSSVSRASHSPSNSHSSLGFHSAANTRPTLSISVPGSERSVISLEKEIMRLQEVLREREIEISVLEESLKVQTVAPPPAPSDEDKQSTIANGDVHADVDVFLSPKTMNRFENIRKVMENGHDHPDIGSDKGGSVSEADESLDRLNELMLAMAQKESHHREVVDTLNDQLSQVHRQHDDLVNLSRDQAVNMSTEFEALQEKYAQDLAQLEQIRQHEANLTRALERAKVEHAADVEHLRAQHEEALQAKGTEVDDLAARLRGEYEESLNGLRDQLALEKTEAVHKLVTEHETSFTNLRDQLSEASIALERSHQEHEESFGKLKAEHEEELRLQVQAANDLLAQTRQEHETIVAKAQSEHEEALKRKDAASNATLQRTEEEYYNALTKLRGDHADALEKYAAEAAATLERLREEHAGELRIAEIAREGSLSESQSSRNLALQELQDEHAAAIARKETSFAEELERLRADHIRALTTKDGDYDLEMNKLRSEHEGLVAKFREESRIEVERLNAELGKAREESTAASTKAREEVAAVSAKAREEVSAVSARAREEAEVASAKAREEAEAASAKAQQEAEAVSTKAREEAKVVSTKAREEAEVASAKAREEAEAAFVKAREEVAAASAKAHEEMAAAVQAVREQHALLLQEITRGHEEDVAHLKTSHETALAEADARTEQHRTLLIESHTEEVLELKSRHQQSLAEVNASLVAAQEQHLQDLEAGRAQSEQLLAQEKERQAAALADLERLHSQEQDTLRKDHDLLLQEVETYKAAADEYTGSREDVRRAHEEVLNQKANIIDDMKNQLATVHDERDALSSQVGMLQAELEKTRTEQSELIQEASKRESLVEQLENHRSTLAEMQESLQRVKDEKDNLQIEKNRQEAALRELQAQVARSSSPPGMRPVPDRNMSYTRATGLPAIKLPPPTPPPSVPPPPAPKLAQGSGDSGVSSPTQSSPALLTSPRESTLESPTTPMGYVSANGPIDPKIVTRLEQQAKHLDEQEAMIKTLNKQLTHCESDLQTHIDLVSTLETSLGDAEKNLRKARMQATELARERDTLNGQLDSLRNELQDAKREVVTVRRSIVEEKQSLEQRLDEERKAKERARQQLDTRMDELQKRKSKFACL